MSRRGWLWSGIVLLLLLFWSRALVNLHQQSPVVDEPAHLVRGLAYWRTGDLRLQRGHPPLSHALNGAFSTLEPNLPSPAEMPGWSSAERLEVAQNLLWERQRPIERLLFLARWPTLAVSLILSALLLRWTTDLFGPLAGLLALILYTFDPNVLAHSTLATTDLITSCLTFAACYAFHRWLRRPTTERGKLAGLTLGLALGSKLSTLLLMPVLGLALLWHTRRKRVHLRDLLGKFAVILGVGLLTLWAIYRFEVGKWAGLWMPMPTYAENVETLWQHQQGGHAAFLFGHLSQKGWWYYFPALLLIKTPIPLLILLPLGIGTIFRSDRLNWPVTIAIFPALYLAVSIVSSINIGYRHILPLTPLAMMGAAATFHSFSGRSLKFVVPLVLVLWLVDSSLSIHPYYMAYFNELVGGPDEGYRYAVDSNLDWGQDLKRLGHYVEANNIESLQLSYFGSADPDYYLPNVDVITTSPFEHANPNFHPFNPAPRIYAISASHLQGLRLSDPDIFDWFRRQEPIAKAGHSIFVYRVAPGEGSWAGICYAPAEPLEPEKIPVGLGRADLRTVYFDCRSSWVYPRKDGAGWYVVPGYSEGPLLTTVFLQEDMVVFRGDPVAARPALTVYRWDGESDPSTPINHPPASDANDRIFGDLVRFLGSRSTRSVVLAVKTTTVYTYWEALTTPQTPLAIFAHLIDDEGHLIAQSDGLGVTVENWQRGDVIVQAHPFNVPAGTPAGVYTPLVGWYHQGSLERLPLHDSSGETLALELLHVRTP